MPRLPTSEQLGIRPPPQPARGVAQLQLAVPRAGIEGAGMTQLGDALSGTGDVLFALAEKERKHIDAVRVEDTYNQYTDTLLDLEAGKENGYRNIQGGNALSTDILKDYREKRTAAYNKLADSLKSPDQLEAFRLRAKIADQRFDSGVLDHVRRESDVYQKQVLENTVETAKRNSALNYSQPKTVELEIARVRAATRRFAERNGLLPDAGNSSSESEALFESLVRPFESDIHTAVVEQMLTAGQDIAARDYFEKFKDHFTAGALIRVGKAVMASSSEEESMRGADAIWKDFGPRDINAPVRIDLMAQAARDRYRGDPSLAQATTRELEHRSALHNAGQAEQLAAGKAAILGAYNNGNSLQQILRMPEYRALPGDQQQQLHEYMLSSGFTAAQRARAARAYEEGDQAERAFPLYWRMSEPNTLASISEAQIQALQPQLGFKLTVDLLEQRRKLLTPQAIADASIDSEQFNELADRAGLNPYQPNLNKDAKAHLGRLKNRVETLVDREQRASGRKLNRDEKGVLMQREIDRQVMLKEWPHDKKQPAAAVGEKERAKVYVPLQDVPAEYVTLSINYLRSIGKIPQDMPTKTAANLMKSRIERAYGLYMTGGGVNEINAALEDK